MRGCPVGGLCCAQKPRSPKVTDDCLVTCEAPASSPLRRGPRLLSSQPLPNFYDQTEVASVAMPWLPYDPCTLSGLVQRSGAGKQRARGMVAKPEGRPKTEPPLPAIPRSESVSSVGVVSCSCGSDRASPCTLSVAWDPTCYNSIAGRQTSGSSWTLHPKNYLGEGHIPGMCPGVLKPMEGGKGVCLW